ncbi:MAG: hypothetical protein IJY92_05710 [Alphaproteobacteria bacterium]|nr:hypothetical protein [Alphaproteobacteria bacterium]
MKKQILLMLMGTVMISGAALATGEGVQNQVSLTEIAQKVQDIQAHKKEMRKEMKENFVKKLGLTEEQQEKASAIHQKSKAEMEDIKKQMKDLRQKADTIRENNKKEFESILTEDQKKTLEQIKTERKSKMKHHKKRMHKGMKNKVED